MSAAIRTGNPTRVLLDSGKTSTTTLFASGTATAIVYTRIQLPLDLRNEDTGCNDPYVTTGYGEFTQTFFFRGKVGPKGLLALQVSSPPDILSVVACLAPGHPDAALQRLPGAGPDHGQRQDDRERGPLRQGLMRRTRLILSALTAERRARGSRSGLGRVDRRRARDRGEPRGAPG